MGGMGRGEKCPGRRAMRMPPALRQMTERRKSRKGVAKASRMALVASTAHATTTSSSAQPMACW